MFYQKQQGLQVQIIGDAAVEKEMDLGREVLLLVGLPKEQQHRHLGERVKNQLQIGIPRRLDRLSAQGGCGFFELTLLPGKMGGQLPLRRLRVLVLDTELGRLWKVIQVPVGSTPPWEAM